MGQRTRHIDRGRCGFTLLETAIVLVIVGVVIGSILFGRDLIRAAELRGLQRQVEQFSTAVHAFEAKYGCLPGDCKNATETFGLNAGCPSGDPLMAFSDTPTIMTCNGDGDGKLDANATFYEGLALWQQLAAAGLIGGSYTGGFVSFGDSVIVPRINVPAVTGGGSGAFWYAADGDTWSLAGGTSPALVPGSFGSILLASTVNSNSEGVLSPADMSTFDSKFDDGGAVTGHIMVPNTIGSAALHCTDAADETIQDSGNANARYLANDAVYKNQPTCMLMYRGGW